MEPTPEEAAEGSILVKVLAAVLERLVNSNTSTARSDPGQVTKFHALKAPGIGVEAYLDRVHKYASCSNECFILALIYIDRLIERNNFLLTELNVHRVVITAILLAAKFFDDAYYNNAYYAKVGGVLVSELNGLEVDFLFRINFSLHVQPDVFEKYKAELVAHSINSGLISAHPASSVATSQHLPHIPEMESGSSSSTMSSVMATPPELTQQQQQPTSQAPAIGAASHDSVMAAPPQVTPSPPFSSQDIAGVVNGNICVGGPMYTSYTIAEPTVQAPPPQPTDQLNTMTAAIINTAPFQPIQYVPSKAYTQQEQQQSLMLQRTNSLPVFSSGRCVNHAFKLPYSAPPMPATAPIMAVDQVQYQLMMNQLFPIENTLVHHNHHHESAGTTSSTSATIQDHHTNATAGLVGHHPGLQGAGIGSMAYQVSWSGQIR